MSFKRNNNTNSCGESLSETLIATLIISLAMIMLFSGAKIGTELMHKSNAEYQNYYDKVNEYEEAQASFAVEYYKNPEETEAKPEQVNFGMEPHKHNW